MKYEACRAQRRGAAEDVRKGADTLTVARKYGRTEYWVRGACREFREPQSTHRKGADTTLTAEFEAIRKVIELEFKSEDIRAATVMVCRRLDRLIQMITIT